MLNLEGCKVMMADRSNAHDIIKLVNAIQPDIQWTPEHCTWQLFAGPAGDADVYTIWSNKEMVAMYVHVNKRMHVEGEIWRGGMIQDVMTLPAFRRRGFLNHLGVLCLDDVRKRQLLEYTFPNQHSVNSFTRSGWHALMRVPLRTKKLLTEYKPEPPQPAPTFRQVQSFPAAVENIWRNSGLKVGVHRDAAFLNWRYSRPDTEYIKLIINDHSGFMILKKYSEDGRTTVHLLDLVVEEPSRDIIPKCLDHAEAFARIEKSSSITCWLPVGHPYEPYFDRFGFELEREYDRFVMSVAPYSIAETYLKASNWHLSQGDSDVY